MGMVDNIRAVSRCQNCAVSLIKIELSLGQTSWVHVRDAYSTCGTITDLTRAEPSFKDTAYVMTPAEAQALSPNTFLTGADAIPNEDLERVLDALEYLWGITGAKGHEAYSWFRVLKEFRPDSAEKIANLTSGL